MQSVIHTAANSHTSNTTPRRYTPSSRFTATYNRHTPFTTSTASQRRNTSSTAAPTNTASSTTTSNPMNLHLVNSVDDSEANRWLQRCLQTYASNVSLCHRTPPIRSATYSVCPS